MATIVCMRETGPTRVTLSILNIQFLTKKRIAAELDEELPTAIEADDLVAPERVCPGRPGAPAARWAGPVAGRGAAVRHRGPRPATTGQRTERPASPAIPPARVGATRPCS